MVLGQGGAAGCLPLQYSKFSIHKAKYCLGLKIDSSIFFFFLNLIFFNFFVFLKTSNINVDSMRKIKINALKVERVRKTFENLNYFETMLKMLKTMQMY